MMENILKNSWRHFLLNSHYLQVYSSGSINFLNMSQTILLVYFNKAAL